MVENKIETEKITIAEVPARELHEASGVFDEQQGRELTNLEAVKTMYEAQDYRVWVSANGAVSQEAQDTNSALSRDPGKTPAQKAAAYIVAIRGERPVKEAGE